MLAVVTGANGHVGANLVRHLLGEGIRVRAMVHSASNAIEGQDAEVVQGDVRDRASLDAAFAGADLVFHLASLISIDGDRNGLVPATNVQGARNVAEAALAAGVKRLIHTSSIHAFRQHPKDEPLDETRQKVSGKGFAAYDLSKAAGEDAVREVIARGLDAVIVNPSAVIGPNDYYPSRMGRFVIGVARRRLPALVPGGFDWVDVRDVCAGMVAAADKGRTGENYLLSGHWHTVREMANVVAELAGVRAPALSVPIPLALVGAPFVVGFGRLTRTEPLYTMEAIRTLAGSGPTTWAKAKNELGYSARPAAEAFEASYRWFRDNARLG